MNGLIPSSEELGIPLERVAGISEAVPVDLYLPGCPPRADDIHYMVDELLSGRMPLVLSSEHFTYD